MATEYIHITYTSPEGKRRRSFSAPPELNSSKVLVSYHLVEKDGDGKNETIIGFAKDSGVRVRPARMNPNSGKLEIVKD